MSRLIYIADPMCAWSYGFGPELAALLDGVPGLPVDIVVGGLLPYNKKAMDAETRETMKAQWEQVARETNLPFSYDFLSGSNLVYDTEPACRAVVAARKLAPQAALYAFHEIQRMFFSEGQDVMQGEVLARIVCQALAEQGYPVDEATFLTIWNSDVAVKATNDDFLLTEKWELKGFPTLVLERDGKLELVTAGYVAMPRLIELLQALVDGQEAPPAAK
ncbi:DsbA family protein [Noviherbaspirillum denitrificans]|uniref:Thioredoxin n=1 Tax=Noviherbaspirillum denitrificans TaxID=1968433 RepID=A0A254TJY8_9BURK|nr:DsbA family protein [Noviherbaspirillum denitrificans]OWW21632.1 thioredoxin [Noviherbaspirillum denitrificans]